MKPINGFFSGTAALFLLLVMALLLPNTAHGEDVPHHEFAELRTKWRTWLVGPTGYKQNAAGIRAALLTLDELVVADNRQGYWDTMEKGASRSFLWDSVDPITTSEEITKYYGRLKTMALAYSTEGSTLYLDQNLKEDLVDALDWMYDNRYNERELAQSSYTEHWEINGPKLLNDITVLMYDELSDTQRRNYMNAVSHFAPCPTVLNFEYLSEKAMICVITGILESDSDSIFKGQAALTSLLPYVKSGPGFYEDGSFVDHNKVASTGLNGRLLLVAATNIVNLLDGSRWSVADPNRRNIFRWAKDSLVPFIYRGALMDAVRGRAISRYDSQDHVAGREALVDILRACVVSEPHEVEYLQRFVKRSVTDDTTFSRYYGGLDIADAIRLNTVMSDPTIPLGDEIVLSKVYPSMARALYRQTGFAFAISMFSPHIVSADIVTGINLKSGYTSVGMTSLYTNDLNQFGDNYWATVDRDYLPGTTVQPYQLKAQSLNTQNWVGGTSMGDQFGAVGMDYSAGVLHAKKSWFMFPDETVCVGRARLNNGHPGIPVVVENLRLQRAGTLTTVNSESMPSTPFKIEFEKAEYAHIAGEVNTGYTFPCSPTPMRVRREKRSGSWSEVNKGAPREKHLNEFLVLDAFHVPGANFHQYCYTILPGKTADQTKEYYKQPNTHVLANTEDVHAVKLVKKGLYTVTAANFWEPSSVSFITADQAQSVIVKVDDVTGTMYVAISDPTHAQATVSVDIEKEGYSTVDFIDKGVSIQFLPKSISITVRTEGSMGATFNIVFTGK